MNDAVWNAVTSSILKDKPNTYTFTKQLGEVVLAREGKDLPVAIVRPTIVSGSWREPLTVSTLL